MVRSVLALSFKFLFFTWLSASSCTGQERGSTEKVQSDSVHLSVAYASLLESPVNRELLGPYSSNANELEQALQLRLYITSITQDKTGAYWFGTNGYGVLRYQGDTIEYLTTKDGFMSAEVRDMVEDQQGNMWFATANGLMITKTGVDKLSFRTFTKQEGLGSDDVRSLALDRKGNLWIGTALGVNRLDASKLTDASLVTSFELPVSGQETSSALAESPVVHSITEDKMGRMWFGTNQGVYLYDAATVAFAHLSVKDGLCEDDVHDILEDKDGRIWFATKRNGVCRLDAGFTPGSGALSFTQLETTPGHDGSTEVTHLLEDGRGSMWFSVNGVSTYRCVGDSLSNYFAEQSCVSHTFGTAYQDQQGRIWFGGWLGLFRYYEPC